ncbi:MAG: ATP-binding cassette domain-containing protein [Labilithrix sp.]|nr:ATP-binding cassette domain-containing protein [Labilithrix sp.]MCW5812667.1 ATP-binding cassette domain-containing protein [Labilithrix sp.]
MRERAVLRLRGFGLAFNGTPVLAHVDLDLPETGLVVLVGPAGSGKSALLRTLAGVNDAHPSLSTWGVAELDARGSRRGVGLVMQHSRFFMSSVRENLVSALPNREKLEPAAQTAIARDLLRGVGLRSLVDRLDADVVTLPKPEQRLLAIVRATAGDPLVLLADEPTSGLDDEAAIDVIALLRAQAAFRAVLFITHNQRHALAAGGTTCLLAGGTIVESAPTAQFFRAPATELGRRFVATGSCPAPSPGARSDDLDEGSPQPTPLPAGALGARAAGPRGFFWIVPGRLGGLPRPGIVAELEHDLAGLAELGVGVLVTLEESVTVAPERLAAIGVAPIHFPIPDMGAPDVVPAIALCARVAAEMARGRVVALHCRAGLGRTGTLLASQLVWSGESAVRAIERVRQINPRCIQSDAQIAFLRAFEAAVRPASSPPTSKSTELIEPRRSPNVA